MKVGDDGDLELEIRRPLRRHQMIARDAKPQHGLAEPVSRGRDAERAETADEPKELTS